MSNTLPLDVRQGLEILVFDLDGVITSENAYWDTARFVVWHLMEDVNCLGLRGYFGHKVGVQVRSAVLESVISNDLILNLKSRSVNSNWDITFIVASLHIIAVIDKARKDSAPIDFPIIFGEGVAPDQTLLGLSRVLHHPGCTADDGELLIKELFQSADDLKGPQLLIRIKEVADDLIGFDTSFFEPQGPLWQLCYRVFQARYGEVQQSAENLHQPNPTPEDTRDRRFPIRSDHHFMSPISTSGTVVGVSRLKTVLKRLHGKYILGIATGRPRSEAVKPLAALGLLEYFDAERIVTSDDVLAAEEVVARSGKRFSLGKPHPFSVMKAIHPNRPLLDLCGTDSPHTGNWHAAFIGDSASDIMAAKAAGCVSIGVLSGLGKGKQSKNKKLALFTDLGCDCVISNVLELPSALGLARTPPGRTQTKIESMYVHRTLSYK